MSLLRTAKRAAVAGAVVGRVQRRQQDRWAAQDQAAQAAPQPQPVAPAAPAAPAALAGDLIGQLERLGKLRDGGVLSEAEFAAQKARLLA